MSSRQRQWQHVPRDQVFQQGGRVILDHRNGRGKLQVLQLAYTYIDSILGTVAEQEKSCGIRCQGKAESAISRPRPEDPETHHIAASTTAHTRS